MILGCILLVLILNGYEFKTKVSALTPVPSASRALAFAGSGEDFSTIRL
jgi:hypothetical protein